jgi:hypothetical protein
MALGSGGQLELLVRPSHVLYVCTYSTCRMMPLAGALRLAREDGGHFYEAVVINCHKGSGTGA